MLGHPVPGPRTWTLHKGKKEALPGWSQELARQGTASLQTEEVMSRIREDVGALPSGLLREVESAFREWWPVRPRHRQALDLLVVQPDGRRQKASFHHRVIRIGRSPSCNLQLQHDTVSSEHCEIRVDEDRSNCDNDGNVIMRLFPVSPE